jgi:glycosyltransferase involved in cell wall biosynthesis
VIFSPENVMASIIIPVYNSENYIEECIESVLNQTFKAFEIIVVDDGSTDRTPEIVGKYSGIVTYIRHANQGPSVARNAGLKISRGKYLCFLDADDIYKPERLEKLIGFLEDYPELGYTFSDVEVFDGGQIKEQSLIARWGNEFYSIPHHAVDECKRLFTTTLTPYLIKLRSFIHTSTITIRRNALPEKTLFIPGFHYGEDAELWARIAYRADGGYIDEVLSKKRIVENSLIHDKSRAISNVGDLLRLREIQKSIFGADSRIKNIIEQQILDYAVNYSWALSEVGNYSEAWTILIKYLRKFPTSGRLLKVMVKNLFRTKEGFVKFYKILAM